jgi:hypothetical protein
MKAISDLELNIRKAQKKDKDKSDQIYLDNFLRNLKRSHDQKRLQILAELEASLKKLRTEI